MTLCQDCKHHSVSSRWGEHGARLEDRVCGALYGQEHPVSGGHITHIACDLMRMTLCGWNDPKLFEELK
jgi:hypothetical protein